MMNKSSPNGFYDVKNSISLELYLVVCTASLHIQIKRPLILF